MSSKIWIWWYLWGPDTHWFSLTRWGKWMVHIFIWRVATCGPLNGNGSFEARWRRRWSNIVIVCDLWFENCEGQAKGVECMLGELVRERWRWRLRPQWWCHEDSTHQRGGVIQWRGEEKEIRGVIVTHGYIELVVMVRERKRRIEGYIGGRRWRLTLRVTSEFWVVWRCHDWGALIMTFLWLLHEAKPQGTSVQRKSSRKCCIKENYVLWGAE